MKQYTSAIRLAVIQKNWIAALTLALMMPDICGGLETPGSRNSKQRSERWFDQHMGHHYKIIRRPRSPRYPSHLLYTGDQWAKVIEKWQEDFQKIQSEPDIEEVWMNGGDCYALRCALLHEGSDQLDRQKSVLDSFGFIVSRPNMMEHKTMVDTGTFKCLRLDTATFCSEIADAVDLWADQVHNDPAIQQEISRLLKFRAPDQPFTP